MNLTYNESTGLFLKSVPFFTLVESTDQIRAFTMPNASYVDFLVDVERETEGEFYRIAYRRYGQEKIRRRPMSPAEYVNRVLTTPEVNRIIDDWRGNTLARMDRELLEFLEEQD